MNHKEKLLSLHREALDERSRVGNIDASVLENITVFAEKCFTQKGVYTVFVTLAIHKTLHPEQDVRKHQTQIEGGFSGRTIDTQFITPTLKELGLPSMAESGWLTRSLEQPYPYTLDYRGKIRDREMKRAFLELVDSVESQRLNPEYILIELFKQIITIQKENEICIKPLENPEKLTISRVVDVLETQFSFHYGVSGGAKLPVLAFYAMYGIILDEISRYDGCELKEMGSHTTCDTTSKSAGDIEVFKDGELFEAVEIKLNKKIDANMLRIAREKIIRHNPKRYYVLSCDEIEETERKAIDCIIKEVKDKHGCQLVINGVLPTLKYYMRLISTLERFLVSYSELIQEDSELQALHKRKWDALLREVENEL